MRTEEPRSVRLNDYRPPEYRVSTVSLEFALHPETTRVRARLALERTGTESAPLVLCGEALRLVAIALDGRDLAPDEFAVGPETLTIPDPPASFELDIQTEIDPAHNTTLEGLYVSKGIFCTQCEAEGFRRITYFPDRPDVLAVYTVRIEADKSALPVLLSNGNPIERGNLPDGRHFAVWHDPFPKPCYLFALVAGDLGHIADVFVTRSGRHVALRIYVEHGNEPRALYAMDSLKRAMRWDEDAYGREYDLDTFMIVAVSAFNFGAMENKGLNIFNDKVLLASPETATDDDYARIEGVVAHEYFHNWSGNRVTCRDWFQLSLKEGLTVFRDQSFSADMRSAAVKRIEDVRLLRLRQFAEDAGPLAHPVQPQAYITIDNFYTATVYEKGAEIIGMLKTIAGEDDYRKTTDLYFARHDGTAATVEDWVRCFEDATGRKLDQFRLWYAQAGTPTVHANGFYDESQKTFTLDLRQSLGATPGQPHKQPMHIPLRLGLITADGKAMPLTLDGENAIGPEERVVELSESEQRFVFVNVTEPPLLSLGRRFSAPVILKTSNDRAALAALMARDSDGFSRWEAGQNLSREVLLDMVQQACAGQSPQPDALVLHAMKEVLERAHEDRALAAQMLAPPLESEIALAMEIADPDAIHTARTTFLRAVARAHRDKFLELYRSHEHGAYSPDAAAAGRRALRNACLRYLTAEDSENAAELAYAHYHSATNMTDMIAGLSQLSRMDSRFREAAFEDFHNRFRSDSLVLDKWFALQAMSPLPKTLQIVRGLTRHAGFDLRNPNRVRALVGAFAANHLRFHDKDGEGYALVGETLRSLDSVNPQVAARMAGAFETWRRYDSKRQALMRRELEALLALPQCSSNMFEVAGKMLGRV